jgi:ATP-binding cassette subfamily A (ABC1) protein 8
MSMQLVAVEKQQRIVGLLRLMGMREGAYWSAWLLSFAVLSFVAALLAAIMGTISQLSIYKHVDFSIHLVGLFLYLLSMNAFAMMVAAFVKRPLLLNIIGFLVFFLAVLSNIFFGQKKATPPATTRHAT